MSQSFAITTATNNLAITAGERRNVSFTVSNISQAAVRGRVAVVPQGETPAGWFALIGEAERDFVAAENEQFTYEIVVPPETPSGRHLFSARIVNVDIDKIEEDFADSPVVALDVTAVAKPKKFPWWIVAVIAAVVLLVVIAVTAFVLTRKPAVVASIAAVPDPVTAGTLLGYTVTVSNTGSATAHHVVFTDTIPAGVTLVGADERCTPTEMGDRVVCRAEELPRNETLAYSLAVAVSGSARNDIENQIALATDQTDPEEGPAIFRATTGLAVETSLRLDFMASASTTKVGEAVGFTAVISNTGPSDATGIVLTYVIPAGTTLSNIPESCDENPAGELVCALGSLGQQSEASLSFTLTPGGGTIGTLNNEVTVTSVEATAEPVVVPLTVAAASGLTLVVEEPAVSEEAFLTNEAVTFRLRASNNAMLNSGEAALSYQLPANVNFDVSQADLVVGVRDCTRELAARSVTCNLGVLAPGDSQVIELHLIPTAEGTTNHTFRVQEGVFGEVDATYALLATGMDVCASGCPFNSILTAVNAAPAGDTVGIGPGTYLENVAINKNLVLQGSRAGQTIVDGKGVQRVFSIAAGAEVTMNRLVIQNGLAAYEAGSITLVPTPGADGGGVLNMGTLVMNRCLVRNNRAGDGFPGVTFGPAGGAGGRGGHGGGIFNGGTLVLNDSRVANNQAGNGGIGAVGFFDPFFSYPGGAGGEGGSGGGVYTSGGYTNNNSVLEGNAAGFGGVGGPGSFPGAPGAAGQGPDFYNSRIVFYPGLFEIQEFAPLVPFDPSLFEENGGGE